MAEPFYREIIKRGWDISWRFKFLWILGAFTVILGIGGELDLAINNLYRIITESKEMSLTLVYQGSLISNIFEGVKNIFIANPIWSLILLLLFLLIIWLAFVSQAALIFSAAEVEKKKYIGFSSSFKVGKTFFGQAFALTLFWKIFVYGLWIIIGLPLSALATKGQHLAWNVTFVIFSIIVLVVLNIIISLIIKYALAFVVLQKQNVITSIQSGWNLFVKNWLISIEMVVILFVINFILGLGLVIALFIVTIPFGMLYLIFTYAAVPSIAFFVLFSGIILITLLLILGTGLISVFQYSSWTLIYMKLVEGKGVSKLYRLITARVNR